MTLKKVLFYLGLFVLAAMLTLAVLLYAGILQINHPSAEKFPVKGVDVSSYQGDIDWKTLSDQGIRFAYIKATEGSSMEDRCFCYNWSEAAKTDLRIGAYHFFSFETSGQTQAENYIRSVKAPETMLPPAADVEPYGKYTELTPTVLDDLSVWLRTVETQYGIKPIIYTSNNFYSKIKAAFPTYDIWIRSVYGVPSKQITWVFWQYSSRMRLDGYSGDERFIDMNVFAGTEEEFRQYGYRS